MALIKLKVLRYGTEGRDAFGDPTIERAEYTINARQIYPRSSSESAETNRDGIVTGWTIHTDLGANVGPHDLIEIDGKWWEVDGEIAVWDERSQPLRHLGFRNSMRLPHRGIDAAVINVKRHDG